MVVGPSIPPQHAALGELGTIPRPALTTRSAFALCEKCGHAMGCEESLHGLVAAETDHALTGCNGMMRLKSINDMAREGRLKLPGSAIGVRPKPEPRPVRTVKDGTVRRSTIKDEAAKVSEYLRVGFPAPPPRPEPTSAPGPGIKASR